MERRTALALVMAGIASPAFAQNRFGSATPLPGPEQRHVQETQTAGSLSLALSRVAEQKASFPKLKQFAQFEVAEQETVADVLKSIQNNDVASGTVQAPSDEEVEQHLDPSGRQMLQKLKAAPQGREFDRQYLDAQTDGHHKLLQIQEQYLESGRNLNSVNVAKLARGMIKEHLQLLADIGREMGEASTTGAAPPR